nr:hypothetical protein [Sphingomonas quercus]
MFTRLQRHKLNIEEQRAARGRDPEAESLRAEVRLLKDRLAVLERIATDNSSSLDRQIEALRDRDGIERR